ncbi:flagellar hook protein FlgE [Dissulfurispira thermophila]|uniref:Flagellar hook protein FlgE n=1 Tax=Dissulfurispira thermophila TaxID=2715679 RepID=A0A7G1H3E3_9BACT|nr:flagellar hook protein FlgE [Dissulfurispira thermophila]BCB96466.1 flagellar hook protein FlgE [Dissulfurispira thermophila]
MSLLSLMYTSISGLTATSDGISVIGNNIANLNTTGFKGSRTMFGDVYAKAIDNVGLGTVTQSITTQFSQGPIFSTGNPLDFAIQGEGFFIVKDSNTNKEYYTRAGEFSLNKDSIIINPDGLRLQGYIADDAGNISQTLSDIEILPKNTDGIPIMPGQSTSTAEIVFNLSGSPDETIYSSGTLLNPLDSTKGPQAGTYNYSIAMTVYDSEGRTHAVEIYFKKTGFTLGTGSTWDAHVIWNSGKTIPNYHEQIINNLTFDTAGNMTSSGGPFSVNLTWDADDWDGDISTPPTTPAAQTVSMDFTGSTQYGSPYSTVFQKVNGYPEGGLTSFRMDKDGILYGLYSNGWDKKIAQLALARFNAPTELNRIGKNLFEETYGSGNRIIVTAGTGGGGNILSNSLEMSNIDLAKEFVTMMMLQKAYNASSVALSTSIEMLKSWDNII